VLPLHRRRRPPKLPRRRLSAAKARACGTVSPNPRGTSACLVCLLLSAFHALVILLVLLLAGRLEERLQLLVAGVCTRVLVEHHELLLNLFVPALDLTAGQLNARLK
jgi:hypothetical protein